MHVPWWLTSILPSLASVATTASTSTGHPGGNPQQVRLAFVEFPACFTQAKRLRLFPGAHAAILRVEPEGAKAFLVHCAVGAGKGSGCNLKLAQNNPATCSRHAFCKSSEKTVPRLISLGTSSPNAQIRAFRKCTHRCKAEVRGQQAQSKRCRLQLAERRSQRPEQGKTRQGQRRTQRQAQRQKRG